MKKIIFFVIAMFLVNQADAQSNETDPLSKSKISLLEFMAGSWKGSGWMMGRDGARSEFSQSEKIQFKLDSTMLLVEGMGMADGLVIHNALAFLTYNKTNDAYAFRSYLQNGMNSEFQAELTDGKLTWYQTPNVRYVMGINENKQWYETGEFLREDSWTLFFEMTLNRVE